MAPYKVMVDDNFHYMDEDARREYGVFSAAAGAISACKQLVDEGLRKLHRPGMTADELYERYTSFGDDPFIVALEPGDVRAEFSAWEYAKDRCRAATQAADGSGTAS